MDYDRERLSGALQGNILVLLCFDDKSCKAIRMAVGSPKLFESKIYREVAGCAIDFIDKYGEAIKDHLPDEMEEIIKGDDRLVAQQYEKLLRDMHAQRETVNATYVLSQLQRFVRLQTMKSALIASVEAAEEGDIDKIEVLWNNALKAQVQTFEGGINLGDSEQALSFLESDEKPFLMGVRVLDDAGIGPARKTLMMVQAPLKRGKSWFLAHIGKMAMLQSLSVVHITLEMSEAKTTARYLQSIFGITKRDATVRVPQFRKARDGSMEDVFYENVKTMNFADADIRAELAHRIKRRLSRKVFRIKAFASGSLTMAGLDAYLDALERFEGIVPDVLIIDYAELMALGGKDAADKRNAIGKTFVELRGLAHRRNCAVVTAGQTNRPGSSKRVSDADDASEDYSKGFTVDTLITYNQTREEYELGLARLFVAAHRDDEGRQTALITQSYKMGQFCVDSVLVDSRHWDFMDRRGRRSNGDAEEDR